MNVLKDIYRYREMVRSLVKRDLQGRYKNSALGFLWTFLNPLFQLCVYSFLFTVIIPMPIEKYYIHLFVVLVPWIFFSTCMTAGSRVVLDQQDMVKKIYFPRTVLPIAFTLSQLVNMLLSMLVILVIVIVSGHGINPVALLALPGLVLLQFLVCLAIVLIVSAVTVYLRDMEMILGVVAFALMYAAPVIYAESYIPENIRGLYYCNPMAGILSGYRSVFYYKELPDVSILISPVLFGTIGVVLGFLAFGRMQRHFVEQM